MTGSIRTIRADKGFGFIKDATGKEYFFHRSAVYGEGLEDLREGDSASNSTLAQGRKVPGPRTCAAHRPNGTDGTRAQVRGLERARFRCSFRDRCGRADHLASHAHELARFVRWPRLVSALRPDRAGIVPLAAAFHHLTRELGAFGVYTGRAMNSSRHR